MPERRSSTAAKRRAKPEPRRFDAVPASDIEVVALRWLYTHLIPLRKVTILAGLAGVGKGLFMAHLAARATHGELPGDVDEPINVLFIAGEDAAGDTVVPRLRAAGADVERVFFLTLAEGDWFAIPDDIDELRDLIETQEIGLVFIDPLADYLSAAIDEWKQREMRAALRPLVALAQELGVAIVVVIHMNKRGDGTFQRRLTGSHASSDVARSAVLVAHDPADPDGDTRTVTSQKSNLAKTRGAQRFEIGERIVKGAGPVPYVKSIEDAHDVAAGDVLDLASGGAGTKLKRAEALIVEALTDQDWRPSREVFDLCESAGVSRTTAERAARKLRKSGRLEGKQGRGRKSPPHFWRLIPDGASEAPQSRLNGAGRGNRLAPPSKPRHGDGATRPTLRRPRS